MNRKHLLYVENITPSSTEQDLTAYFEKFAPVQQVYFLREKQCTKRSIAAFVQAGNETDVGLLLLRNQQNYRGKRLFIVRADQPAFFQADHSVIVRNITSKISEENLFDHFEECGKIAFLQIRTDDFAYIGFEDKLSVRSCMNKNNMPLKGSHLKIQLLNRNLEIMIVNLDTLQSRMPDLYRKMVLPPGPRQPDSGNQQQTRPPQQQQSQPARQQQQQQQAPQQQSQPVRQQQQQFGNQQQQSQPSRQQQQFGNQEQQNRQQQQPKGQFQQQQQQQRGQPQQQQQQRGQPQQQQQRGQQQQQQQQRGQPQQQQQRGQPQQQQKQPPPQQQPLPQRQPQAQRQQMSTIQLLKEKANAFAGKQQQPQQKPPQQVPAPVQPAKPAAAPVEAPAKKAAEPTRVPTPPPPTVSSAAATPEDTEDDVEIIEEPMDTAEVIVDSDTELPEVVVDTSVIPPVPSQYQPQPDDIMRPVKASEIAMSPVAVKNAQKDPRSVWVNNIQPETGRLTLVLYMEQFGDVESCKIGSSNNCYFTRWAKVCFTSGEAAKRATEYFLHPFHGRYLFVLACDRCIDEEPGQVFVLDYLSKYLVYEDVAKRFKSFGEMFYLVRLADNSHKVRIFFLNNVDTNGVLGVKSLGGRPINVEPFVKGMTLKLAKDDVIKFKQQREIMDAKKEARMARILEIYKDEALDRCDPVVNPDGKSESNVVIMSNVLASTTREQINHFFQPIGVPTFNRREPEMHNEGFQRVFVGFRTLSMVLKAIKLPPTMRLNGCKPFVFAAWTKPHMTEHNSVRMFFTEKEITAEDIYNGLIHFGNILYVEKEKPKKGIIMFDPRDDGIKNCKIAPGFFIGPVRCVGKEPYIPPPKVVVPSAAPIVIDDEDEVVEVANDSPAKNNQPNQQEKKQPQAQNQPNQKNQQNKQQQQQKQPQQQQQKQQQQKQQQQKQQQQKQQQQQQQRGPPQQQQRPGRGRNRNPFAEGRAQQQRPHPYQQQHPQDQRRGMNPWGGQDFQQQHQQQHDHDHQQFMPDDHRFNRNMDDPFDRFNQGGRNMSQLEQMMMQQQFEYFSMNQQNDNGFNGPMDSDDPPLEGGGWGQQHQQQQHFNRFSPPRQRSPFGHGFRDDRMDDNPDFGRDSPGIPPNIPEDEIDEYIMRKQEAIKRRLEQLDKQLITSVEGSRHRDFDGEGPRRRRGTVFSDNGDVHYVPNPAAVFRGRDRRGGGRGRDGRGGRANVDPGRAPRSSQDRSNPRDRDRREREEIRQHRKRDPFADVDIVPIIRISEERSPSPKRNREDAFDPAQFDAAWC